MMELELCEAAQLWVYREYRKGLRMHSCGAPVLRISEEEVMLPTFTTWGQPVKESRTQLRREEFSPGAMSLW
jgi:hypothetical protein